MLTDDGTCSLCGRRWRDDPRTPGCYLGQCSTKTTGQRVVKPTPDEQDDQAEADVDHIEELATNPVLKARLADIARKHGIDPRPRIEL